MAQRVRTYVVWSQLRLGSDPWPGSSVGRGAVVCRVSRESVLRGACRVPPGRMGNSRSALKMITQELQDVDKAIEFAKEQDDGELWEDLILYSIDKPRKQESRLGL